MKKLFFVLGCFRDASRYLLQPSRWYIVRLELRTAYACVFRKRPVYHSPESLGFRINQVREERKSGAFLHNRPSEEKPNR